jgi:bacterioferritin-associated ferredoxin
MINKGDYLVCVCMGVMYSQIYDFLMDSDQPSVQLAMEYLQVSTGCSSCIDEVRAIVEEVVLVRKKVRTSKIFYGKMPYSA